MLILPSVSRHSAVKALRWVCQTVSPVISSKIVFEKVPPPSLWPEIIRQADRHALLLSLYLALKHRSQLQEVPKEIVDFLELVFDLHQRMRETLCRQMIELSQALNAVNIYPVWLKGAETFFQRSQEGRMMSDLDLWLPDLQEQIKALQILENLGYSAVADEAPWKNSHHYAPRIHPNWPVRIELHRHVIRPVLSPLLPDENARDRIEWLEWQGCRVGRLSAEHRLLHAMIQATVMATPKFSFSYGRLMKELDVVQRLETDFEGHWPELVIQTFKLPEWQNKVEPFLTLIQSLFGSFSPLPLNSRALYQLELLTAYPRWTILLGIFQMAYSSIGWRLLKSPHQIPKKIMQYVILLWRGQPF